MTVVIDPEVSGPSGTTLDDIISRIRRKLADRENLNTLFADVDELTDTIPFSHEMHAVTRGSLLSVDNEIMYVWKTNESEKTVEVSRGYGTGVEPHVAGAFVTVDGKSRKDIIDAINDELTALSGAGLFQMKSTLAGQGLRGTFALPTLIGTDIYDVQRQPYASDPRWTHVPGWQYSAIDNVITLKNQVWNGNVRVLYKSRFNKLVDGADDIQVATGLHAEAADLLVWGACIRLIAPDEYIRNDFRSQGDTRRPQEVQYRAVALSVQSFQQVYNQRLADEKDRLRRSYPLTRSGW